MNTDTMALVLQQGFPDVGFAISPEYPGETAYEKLIMADGQEKPSLQAIEDKAIELGIS